MTGNSPATASAASPTLRSPSTPASGSAQDTEARAAEADAFLTESESIRDLRSNPLLLSLMCILYRGEGSLPRDRADVYGQCANLLFRQWDARRRIHRELRAGHLLEPALRHLAWWLFCRNEARTAVTERELVAETTVFLRGRGFEPEDGAKDAAREFVEFCRGRMWVFSDAGTTATPFTACRWRGCSPVATPAGPLSMRKSRPSSPLWSRRTSQPRT